MRDDLQGGTFRETIDTESLLVRQSINKGGIFGETIDKGALSWRQSINKGDFLERLNNTGTVLLMVSLLLVNHRWPSHVQYALYVFLSCLRDGGIFQKKGFFCLIQSIGFNLLVLVCSFTVLTGLILVLHQN